MLKTIELVVLPLPLPQTSLFSISSKLPEGGRDTVLRENTFTKTLPEMKEKIFVKTKLKLVKAAEICGKRLKSRYRKTNSQKTLFRAKM